jgi:hypothetical protein
MNFTAGFLLEMDDDAATMLALDGSSVPDDPHSASIRESFMNSIAGATQRR